MSDIAELLTEYLLHGGLYNPELMQHDKVRDLLIDCRDEIARLRDAIRRLAEQDATLSVQGGSVTVTMDATLTDEERNALEFAVETGRVAMHDEATLRKLLDRTGDELSALAPADRQNITQESQNSDTLPAYGVWRDRSDPPPLDKPVLFYTDHLDGFMWIGRRGLLPNDVSHWTPLPEPPNVK